MAGLVRPVIRWAISVLVPRSVPAPAMKKPGRSRVQIAASLPSRSGLRPACRGSGVSVNAYRNHVWIALEIEANAATFGSPFSSAVTTAFTGDSF